MACFENILGIKPNCDCGESGEPKSGYYISDYAGITLQGAANIADETYHSGIEFLKGIRDKAMRKMQNDLLAYINLNFKTNNMIGYEWCSGKKYNTNTISPAPTLKRGILLEKKNAKCSLTKMFIQRIRVKTNFTGQTDLFVADLGGVLTTYTIDLVAGAITEIEVELPVIGDEVKIYIDGSVEVYSNKIDCQCRGGSSSKCAKVKGFTESASITLNTSEGYGIEADVICQCDYTNILCDLSMDAILGQAAYELAGAMYYEESLRTTRFNWMTIYNKEQIEQQVQVGFEAYKNYMENAMLGLRQFVVNADGGCGCIDCSKIERKANI